MSPLSRLRATIGALVTVTLAAALLPGMASSAEAATTWQSGVYTAACGKAPVTAFTTWRQAKVARTSTYLTTSTWSDLAAVGHIGSCVAHLGIPVTLSVPMLPAKSGTLRSGAVGSYNAYWTTFGKTAVKDGYAHATLRIGWEMNGLWFKWSAAKDPAHWKSYWRQIVRTLRKVPGQHFTFEWSPALGTSTGHFNVATAYPGDAYVSYVGTTVYDEWWGPTTTTIGKRWSNLVTEPYGLGWVAAFAKTHHKRVGISEWGLASLTSFQGHGDGDNIYFVNHFYAWMKKSNLAYEIYFNRHHVANEHRLMIGSQTNTTFTKAAAAYRHDFGGL